jgi:hypothetical protein
MYPYALLLLIFTLLFPAVSMAQDESGESGDDVSASQETDVSEDNYRRFMELRDASRRQQDQPYAALAPPRGLEKLDQLPESSQKHLRNELRSIIVEGERWTPAEADQPYPFVASPGAESDPELRRQEAEAWDELVANYHAREAEIHAAQGNGRGETGQQRDVTAGSDERGQRSADSAAASGPAAARGGAGSGGSASEQAVHRQGSSQNALDYLRQSGQLAESAPSPQAGPPAGSNAGGSAPPGTQGSAQAAADASMTAGTAGQSLAQDPAQAQNAADDRAQTQAGEPSGSPADAAEASAQAPDSAVVYRSTGVIAIRDLDKVTGVDDSEESAGPPSSGEEPADEDQPTRPDDG